MESAEEQGFRRGAEQPWHDNEASRLRVLLERLREAEIDFILENLARLDALLVELGSRVEVGERLLEASAIRTFLRTGDRKRLKRLATRRAASSGEPALDAAQAGSSRMTGIWREPALRWYSSAPG